MRTFIYLAPFIFFAGCATIKEAPLAVDAEFESRSQRTQLEMPHWRLKDSVYNKDLFEYSVVDSDVSWQSIERDYRYAEGEKPNFFEWLIFDERALSSFRKVEINKYQKFSYNLQDQKGRAARSTCRIISQNFAKEEYGDRDDKYVTQEQRAQTFLSCRIKTRAGQGYLNLLKDDHGELNIKFDGLGSNIQFDVIYNKNELVYRQNSVEDRVLPPWAIQLSGIAIIVNGKQQGLLSLAEDTDLWLARDLNTQQRALALAISYSLTMFNWIDGDWRAL